MNRIVHGDNLDVLRGLASSSIPLIYIDPPFNTGRRQSRTQMKTIRDEAGDRTGFGGRRYRTELVEQAAAASGYGDHFEDYLGFLRPRLTEAHRILSPTGSLFFHIDPREVHYCKVLLDEIFGRRCFQNEIVWAYDYGARARPNAGRPSTTTSSGTRAIRSSTHSTSARATASPTWPQNL